MLCVYAGLGSAMVHASFHGEIDKCVSHCDSGHGDHEDSNDHDHDHGDETIPHQHPCCHLPTADRASDSFSLPAIFQCILVEIAPDRPLAPDEPVFALDKPPLI